MPATQAKQRNLKAREGEEIWELTTNGRIWLEVTAHNKMGQPISKDVSYGPNKAGLQFRITSEDREANQDKVADEAHDLFRNGLLVRVDADQNEEEETASPDALRTEDLLEIFAKNGNAFQAAVKKLGEIPLRRMREMAEAVDASHAQVRFLEELIEERYRVGKPIVDVELGLDGTVMTEDVKRRS